MATYKFYETNLLKWRPRRRRFVGQQMSMNIHSSPEMAALDSFQSLLNEVSVACCLGPSSRSEGKMCNRHASVALFLLFPLPPSPVFVIARFLLRLCCLLLFYFGVAAVRLAASELWSWEPKPKRNNMQRSVSPHRLVEAHSLSHLSPSPACRLVADMSTRRCCHLTQCRLPRSPADGDHVTLDTESHSLPPSLSLSFSLPLSLCFAVQLFDCVFSCCRSLACNSLISPALAWNFFISSSAVASEPLEYQFV